MIKELTCIECPKGCHIKVELQNNSIFNITGNTCDKGKIYAQNEIQNPVRIITSTVLAHGLSIKMIPVRTDKPIPKELIFKAMEEIRKIKIKKPVSAGDIIVNNFLDTGANLISGREAVKTIKAVNRKT